MSISFIGKGLRLSTSCPLLYVMENQDEKVKAISMSINWHQQTLSWNFLFTRSYQVLVFVSNVVCIKEMSFCFLLLQVQIGNSSSEYWLGIWHSQVFLAYILLYEYKQSSSIEIEEKKSWKSVTFWLLVSRFRYDDFPKWYILQIWLTEAVALGHSVKKLWKLKILTNSEKSIYDWNIFC